MELTLSIVGVGGDARLSFNGNQVRVTWGETSRRERRAIASVVAKARKAKFGVVTVDADGKPDKPARWRDLPGMFGKAKGEVILQGTDKAVQAIACDLMDEEIRERNIVMALQKDNTWGIVKEGDAAKAAEKGEKVEAKSTSAVVGG